MDDSGGSNMDSGIYRDKLRLLVVFFVVEVGYGISQVQLNHLATTSDMGKVLGSRRPKSHLLRIPRALVENQAEDKLFYNNSIIIPLVCHLPKEKRKSKTLK
ncbi:hypothetical protein ACFX2I_037522 [Malus domestica]